MTLQIFTLQEYKWKRNARMIPTEINEGLLYMQILFITNFYLASRVLRF